MIPRVYVPAAQGVGALVDAPADEARWLRDVLRVRAGDDVRVFDGRGAEWAATIARVSRSAVTLALDASRASHAEPRIGYTVVMPALKGDAADAIVRDVVMMGVRRIQPVVTDRSEVSLAALVRGRRQARWSRVAIASAKQSGRAVVPAIDEPKLLDAVLADETASMKVVFVEPAVDGDVAAIATVAPPETVALATGPEGGWTAREVAAARSAGWCLARLGNRVLRAEVAPLVALAACQAVWHDA